MFSQQSASAIEFKTQQPNNGIFATQTPAVPTVPQAKAKPENVPPTLNEKNLQPAEMSPEEEKNISNMKLVHINLDLMMKSQIHHRSPGPYFKIHSLWGLYCQLVKDGESRMSFTDDSPVILFEANMERRQRPKSGTVAGYKYTDSASAQSYYIVETERHTKDLSKLHALRYETRFPENLFKIPHLFFDSTRRNYYIACSQGYSPVFTIYSMHGPDSVKDRMARYYSFPHDLFTERALNRYEFETLYDEIGKHLIEDIKKQTELAKALYNNRLKALELSAQNLRETKTEDIALPTSEGQVKPMDLNHGQGLDTVSLLPQQDIAPTSNQPPSSDIVINVAGLQQNSLFPQAAQKNANKVDPPKDQISNGPAKLNSGFCSIY